MFARAQVPTVGRGGIFVIRLTRRIGTWHRKHLSDLSLQRSNIEVHQQLTGGRVVASFVGFDDNAILGTTHAHCRQRIPHVGKVIHLAESQVRKIEEKMPLRVIRFLEPPADHQQRDAFDEEPRRKGYAIRIPTDADMASARASGRGLPGYVRQKWDEPAARYLFMELCADQANPARSGAYPPPLSEHQGSLWPDD